MVKQWESLVADMAFTPLCSPKRALPYFVTRTVVSNREHSSAESVDAARALSQACEPTGNKWCAPQRFGQNSAAQTSIFEYCITPTNSLFVGTVSE
jgi:hypothetical protein